MGRKTHGEVRWINGKRCPTPEYRAWQALRNRCLNPKAVDWSYYGGRGITVSKRWNRYENFLVDMGRRPGPLYTLDRRNGDGPYSKQNCRWATRAEQAQNRKYAWVKFKTARKVRKLYATGKYRQVDIGNMLGMTQAHVSQIVRGVNWKEVE